MKVSIRGCTCLLLLILCILFLGLDDAYSQSPDQDVQPSSPKDEKFRSSTALLIPWRDGGCAGSGNNSWNGSNCYVVTAAQYVTRTVLTLYKEDASVWFTFDLNPKGQLYFAQKRNFVPFATPGIHTGPPLSVCLRITGESDHWYQVVVNEDSGLIAFVLKSDPEWSRSSFEYWFKGFKVISLSKNHAPLLDSPDGKPVSETEFMHFEAVNFIKLDRPDGEWMYVESRDIDVNPRPYRGWLRWRDGRKFLVGCVFGNDQFVAP